MQHYIVNIEKAEPEDRLLMVIAMAGAYGIEADSLIQSASVILEKSGPLTIE